MGSTRSDQSSAGSTIPGVQDVSPEILEKYKANYASHKVGITNEECVEYYDGFADRYEENLSQDHYKGPKYAAQTVTEYFGDSSQRDARILDGAAGTGYLGELLKAEGFTNIDALEPSQNMLKIAAGKQIYGQLICDGLGDKRTEIENDTYDCLAISGGMGEGHIPCAGLREMIRIVKPGGAVVIVMREEYFTYVKEYIGRLEPFMRELEKRGKWRQAARTVVPGYSFGKNGVVFVFEVRELGFSTFPSEVI